MWGYGRINLSYLYGWISKIKILVIDLGSWKISIVNKIMRGYNFIKSLVAIWMQLFKNNYMRKH